MKTTPAMESVERADLGHDDEVRRLAGAVREAFVETCPDPVSEQILAAVRQQELGVRTWQARWLFAVPAIEILLLVVMRSDTAFLMATVADVLSAFRDAAAPSWQGCREWLLSCCQAAGTLTAAGVPSVLNVLPWGCAALVAALSSGVAVARMEKPHA